MPSLFRVLNLLGYFVAAYELLLLSPREPKSTEGTGRSMAFTMTFLEVFFLGILLASPILIFLGSLVLVLGLTAGRYEGWSRFDTLYWSAITATTVGYGDRVPTQKVTKSLAVMISLVGLIFTGILVSIALHGVKAAFDAHVDVQSITKKVQGSGDKE